MIVYQLLPVVAGRVPWHGTLAEAQTEGKRIAGLMMTSRIRQYDIATDKNGVLGLLNGRPEFLAKPGEKAREWHFTKRGGINEITDAAILEPAVNAAISRGIKDGMAGREPEPDSPGLMVAKSIVHGVLDAIDDRTDEERRLDELVAKAHPQKPLSREEQDQIEATRQKWARRNGKPTTGDTE